MIFQSGEIFDNFKGAVDPDNPFSGQSPGTDGLLDEVVDGAWYQKTYAECKEILVMKISWLWEFSFIVTRQALMFIRQQDWNQCHLHPLYLVANACQRHGMFLDMSLT